MSDQFDTAVEITFQLEGGYVNDADDNGGETKFGISKARFPHVDIANLTRDAAKEIYRKEFWQAYYCDKLPWPVSQLLFDCVVLHNPANPVRWLQRAVGETIDGVMGAKTIAAVAASQDVFTIVEKMTQQRIAYVKQLDDYPKYGTGWHNRHVASLVEGLRWYFKFLQ